MKCQHVQFRRSGLTLVARSLRTIFLSDCGFQAVLIPFETKEELKQVLHRGKRKQCEEDKHVSTFTFSVTVLMSY